MANTVLSENRGAEKPCARSWRGKLAIMAAFVLTAVFGLLAADVDIDWKWDESGRAVPVPSAKDFPGELVDTLFVMSSESTGGVMYCGLLFIVK